MFLLEQIFFFYIEHVFKIPQVPQEVYIKSTYYYLLVIPNKYNA